MDEYNKILFDDGEIFIHNQKTDYISYLETKNDSYRKIIFIEPNPDFLF